MTAFPNESEATVNKQLRLLIGNSGTCLKRLHKQIDAVEAQVNGIPMSAARPEKRCDLTNNYTETNTDSQSGEVAVMVTPSAVVS